MRVVVNVRDIDVPYLDRGDEAVVRVDALNGEEFRGRVARSRRRTSLRGDEWTERRRLRCDFIQWLAGRWRARRRRGITIQFPTVPTGQFA
jgi:hypothetical protein